MKASSTASFRALASFRNGVNGSTAYQYRTTVRCLHIDTVDTNGNRNRRVGIQGAQMFSGQPKRGVEMGPTVIRETGLVAALQTMGHDVLDYGNVPVMELQQEEECLQKVASTIGKSVRVSQTTSASGGHGNAAAKNVKQVADASRLISEWTAKIMRDDRFCLTLGGDHALGIGTVSGASQVHQDLAVLWVDAHADINTPLTSGSGNMHGMSVAFFLKELQPYMSQLPEFSSWIKPRISASNMAYIGLRDVDPGEATILEMLDIAAYSMQDVDRHGIQKITEMALDRISKGNQNRSIHVSYDIDALCESIVKSTGTPVPGGLTLREGISLIEMVHATGRMVSMDLVEVNPLLGTERDAISTAQAAKHLILGALGHVRGGCALNSIPKP